MMKLWGFIIIWVPKLYNLVPISIDSPQTNGDNLKILLSYFTRMQSHSQLLIKKNSRFGLYKIKTPQCSTIFKLLKI